jgi:hypothetical protein
MTWLISIFLNMNLDISFSIFKVHLDAKQFTWKTQNVIPGSFFI